MAYMVNHRQKEIGIRLALGARPRTVVMTILKQGMALTGLGIAIGTLVGSAITAVVASEFYGLTPTDITTLAGIGSHSVGHRGDSVLVARSTSHEGQSGSRSAQRVNLRRAKESPRG